MEKQTEILTEILTEKLNKASGLVMPLLNEEIEEAEYIEAVHSLLCILKEISPEDIELAEIEPEIRMSLGADKNIMAKVATKETDQISLLSTLVVYTECHREGMPNHSRIYMDRVTEVRNHIDHFYHETVKKFCGS